MTAEEFGLTIIHLACIVQEDACQIEDDDSIWLVKPLDGGEPIFYMGHGWIESDFFGRLLNYDEYCDLCDIIIPEEEIEKAKINPPPDAGHGCKKVFIDEEDDTAEIFLGLEDLVRALSNFVVPVVAKT